MKLAKDAKFAAFLDAPADEADTEVRIEVRPGEEEVEEDFDFASRMRRR